MSKTPTRSGNVFYQLAALARSNPEMRPTQLVSAITNNEDAFYWEADRWNEAIESAIRDGRLKDCL